jgi:hypothetical protein
VTAIGNPEPEVTVERGVMCMVTGKDVLCFDAAGTLVDLARAVLVRTS